MLFCSDNLHNDENTPALHERTENFINLRYHSGMFLTRWLGIREILKILFKF